MSLKNEGPICSADGCSRREPCGFACRDEGNFDVPIWKQRVDQLIEEVLDFEPVVFKEKGKK
jgi:hypothetical protein